MRQTNENAPSYGEIYEMEKSLAKENRKLFDKLCDVIDTAPIAINERLEAKWDILQMLLDAEHEGRSAQDVIGGDIEGFCQDVIQALPHLNQRERVLKQACFVVMGLTAYLLWELFVHVWHLLRGAGALGVITLRPDDLAKFMALLMIFHVGHWFEKRQELRSNWRRQILLFVLFVLAFIACDLVAALVPSLSLGVNVVFYLVVLIGLVVLCRMMIRKIR